MNARMLRHVHDRAADQYQIHPARKGRGVAPEVREQLATALVLVDEPDVKRKRPPQFELAAEALGVRAVRHVGADSDDDARNRWISGGGLNHRALLRRVVHQRANAAEYRAENGESDRGIALGGRHEHGLVRDAARQMPRMVVAVAEEDHEIELAGRALDIVDERRARGALA